MLLLYLWNIANLPYDHFSRVRNENLQISTHQFRNGYRNANITPPPSQQIFHETQFCGIFWNASIGHAF
jgi:hypothetical protein